MILSVLSAIAFLILWQNHPDISHYLRLLEVGLSFLEEDPWALIAVMATLLGLGFPSSPVLVLFGVVIAPQLYDACGSSAGNCRADPVFDLDQCTLIWTAKSFTASPLCNAWAKPTRDERA